ncbi:MAG: dihydroneopterin aldolase [Pseudomonadota bacterium]
MSRAQSLGNEYCVFLREVTLDLPIGILPEERLAPQRVIISVEIYLPDPGSFTSEDIADYVSYADVFDGIKAIQKEGRHIELVENLAETVAGIALSQKGVTRAVVTVAKPDIIAEAGAVGITIERRN